MADASLGFAYAGAESVASGTLDEGLKIMLKSLGKAMLVNATRKGAGVPTSGSLTAALLTTGITLVASRERRAIGIALIAIGGLLLWRQSERVAPVLKQVRPSPPASASDAAA